MDLEPEGVGVTSSSPGALASCDGPRSSQLGRTYLQVSALVHRCTHAHTLLGSVQELEGRHAAACSSREALARDLHSAHTQVSQAQRVLNIVQQEVERWQRCAADAEARHRQVLGEALLASGYIAYLGPLPGSYRAKVGRAWLGQG